MTWRALSISSYCVGEMIRAIDSVQEGQDADELEDGRARG